MNYAGFWIRFLALIFDLAFIFAILIFLGGCLPFLLVPHDIIVALMYLVGIFYRPVFESSRYQGTLGKHIVGIKVTDIEGNQISFVRAFLRHFLIYATTSIGIGYLTIPFTKKKQGIYDMIAGTVVVENEFPYSPFISNS